MRLFARDLALADEQPATPMRECDIFDYQAGLDNANREVLMVLGATTAPMVKPSYVDLADALAQHDAPLIAHFARALRGMVVYFGAQPICDQLLAIERSAATGDLAVVQALLPQLDMEMRRFLPVLERCQLR